MSLSRQVAALGLPCGQTSSYQRRCITKKRQPLFDPISDHFPGGGILELENRSGEE